MIKKSFTAWVIDTNSKEGHGFIGRYWCFGKKYPDIPVGLKGCQIALLPTRSVARKCLLDVKSGFPEATVRQVKVTVESK
ncbi:hypothetical protein LCGC14_2028930 [marine sediment metagenome]|uniref:Uncharacterized protein n=1 Tax=marine sediment metagenome TaxID=412755 RepID=A0A0F9HSD4_9ZZZZ